MHGKLVIWHMLNTAVPRASIKIRKSSFKSQHFELERNNNDARQATTKHLVVDCQAT